MVAAAPSYQSRLEDLLAYINQVVAAAFLDGGKPRWRDQVGARVTLAEWMTAADNRFFARAAANRMWAYFFGAGLDMTDALLRQQWQRGVVVEVEPAYRF